MYDIVVIGFAMILSGVGSWLVCYPIIRIFEESKKNAEERLYDEIGWEFDCNSDFMLSFLDDYKLGKCLNIDTIPDRNRCFKVTYEHGWRTVSQTLIETVVKMRHSKEIQ